MISAPPAFGPLPPPITVSSAANTIVWKDAPAGTYTFQITDSINVACARTRSQTLTITQNALNITLSEYNYLAAEGKVAV